MSELDPLDPRKAVEMYLDAREEELAEATLQSHEYRLKPFIDWCEKHDFDNINDLTGRDIHRYRVKRREEDDLKTVTMKGQLATLKVFLRFCDSIDAVDPELEDKILLPNTTGEESRDEMISPDHAKQILNHLAKYQYASLEHVFFAVLWHTGIRIGTAVSIDTVHYSADEQYLDVCHQPLLGTPLKNKENGERLIALSRPICNVIDDWIDVNHPEVTDNEERDPLFCTDSGRLSRNHARRIAYSFTRPCLIDDTCPHDRNPSECEANQSMNKAYDCPSSLSTHPIRRGAITFHLSKGTPKEVVEDRMNLSREILDTHYDERSEKEKMEQRRQYLSDEE